MLPTSSSNSIASVSVNGRDLDILFLLLGRYRYDMPITLFAPLFNFLSDHLVYKSKRSI
jgi:hypothetical protein